MILLFYYSYCTLIDNAEIKDGRRWESFSRSFPLLVWGRRYLDLNLEMSEALRKHESMEGAQFIFAVFPHGCNADFRLLLDGMLPEVLPQTARSVRTLTASVLFRIPLAREVALWTGCVDARRTVAGNLLNKGRSLLVLPGGQVEQIYTVHGCERLYLSKRKGFVKLALRKKVPLVPAYVFGCSDHYHTSSALQKIRLWLIKATGIAMPLCRGALGLSTCPLPVPTTVIFGDPLVLKCHSEEPTLNEVGEAHDRFCRALELLFNTHKQRLGYGNRKLELL